MSIIEIFVTFMMVWWLVFYFTLPFGNKWDAEGETAIGLAKSSPRKANLKIKLIITTILTIIITAIAYMAMES